MKTLAKITVVVLAFAMIAVWAAAARAAEPSAVPAAPSIDPAGAHAHAPSMDSTEPRARGHKNDPEFRARLERLRSMPPDERRKLMERLREFEKLPPDQRNMLRERAGQWRNFRPEERQRTLQHLREYRQLPPERARQMRERMAAWRSMSREQRLLAQRALGVLKGLPRDKIARLRAMPPAERKAALRKALSEKGIDVAKLRRAGGPGRPRRGGIESTDNAAGRDHWRRGEFESSDNTGVPGLRERAARREKALREGARRQGRDRFAPPPGPRDDSR